MSNAERVDPRAARVEKQNDLTSEPLPSIAAGVSWMLGLVSIPLLFVPPTAIITGFLAIVFGHVAKSKIKRIPELSGESTATNGLLMGYLCFFAALALLPSIRMQSVVTQGLFDSFAGVSEAASGTTFEQIERSFLDSGAAATGNTKEAREIATELATSLNEKRNEFFDGSSGHEIRTLCQLNENGVCVVVLVPDFADFNKGARDGMLNLIWKESQRLAYTKLRPGEEVAIAVRDRVRYHSMEFGRTTKSPDRIAQPDSSFVDVTMFEPFFESKDAAEPELEKKDEERE